MIIAVALKAGWTLSRVCGLLELDRARVWRWQHRELTGTLDDVKPGGTPINTILEWEEQAIVKLFKTWGDIDLSHRKLAHRGSYIGEVWVSPSTVDRVLNRHGLTLAGIPRPPRSRRRTGRAGLNGNQTNCGVGTPHTLCVVIPRSSTELLTSFQRNGSPRS